MEEFLALWSHPTTLVFLIGSAALLVFWRLTNSRITLRWDAKTTAPEPSAQELAEIEIAKDAAKREAKP